MDFFSFPLFPILAVSDVVEHHRHNFGNGKNVASNDGNRQDHGKLWTNFAGKAKYVISSTITL